MHAGHEPMARVVFGDALVGATVLGLDKSSGSVSLATCPVPIPILSLPGRWQESCGSPLLGLYCPKQMGLLGLSLPCELGQLGPVLCLSCYLQC